MGFLGGVFGLGTGVAWSGGAGEQIASALSGLWEQFPPNLRRKRCPPAGRDAVRSVEPR